MYILKKKSMLNHQTFIEDTLENINIIYVVKNNHWMFHYAHAESYTEQSPI